jgi:hypothetical protein
MFMKVNVFAHMPPQISRKSTCLAPSFNDERNLEGKGPGVSSAKREKGARCLLLLAGGWRDDFTLRQAACSSRQTCTQQRDIPCTTPRRCLCFVSHDTFFTPQSSTTTLYTAEKSRTNASRPVSTENINGSSASQLTNMSYRVGMYSTYDITALATEICCQ